MADPDVKREVRRGPPIRLRYLLLIGLIGWGLWVAYPRVSATWKLHSLATTFADYALCMAGPTGPPLLRDNQEQFRQLLRRRLIASRPLERPFHGCAKAARQLTGSVEIARAHRATAWEFVEYGGAAAHSEPVPSAHLARLSDLVVTTRPLTQLTREAWPFIRNGYTELIRSSIRAHEATHPIELPKPAIGSGLPEWRALYRTVRVTRKGFQFAIGRAANLSVYQSTDGGLNWKKFSSPPSGVSEYAERCGASGSERSFNFGISDNTETITVTSLGPSGAPHVEELISAQYRILTAACDDQALVAAIQPEGQDWAVASIRPTAGTSPQSSENITLYRCPFRKPCAPIPLPQFGKLDAVPRAPLDLARIRGVTILAVNMNGIVRVTSTRDDGRTWTPFTVAFDEQAHTMAGFHVKVPERLIALGDDRLLLYGGASRDGARYPVLMSTDYGASWRTP